MGKLELERAAAVKAAAFAERRLREARELAAAGRRLPLPLRPAHVPDPELARLRAEAQRSETACAAAAQELAELRCVCCLLPPCPGVLRSDFCHVPSQLRAAQPGAGAGADVANVWRHSAGSRIEDLQCKG